MGFRNFSNFILSLSIICVLFKTLPWTYDIFVTCTTVLAVIRLSEHLMTITRKYFLPKRVSNGNKAVLITGCDSGFGHAIAKRMDSLGYQVFAACLNPKGEGGVNLAQQCSPRLLLLPLDVTSEQSVDSAKEYVVKHLGNNVLWAVLNNAGIPQAGEIEWAPMDELQRVYEVNTAGTLRVTKAFLPLLRQSKGRLINNASTCGEFICPGFVGYCMSKSATIALSTGLRIEMMKWGVKVISIQPFFYKTSLTNEDSAVEMIEKTWLRVDSQTRRDYGESYKDSFVECTRLLLRRASSRLGDVIDCFEDALTAEDPLSTYAPAYLPDKIGIKILQSLPSTVADNYQRGHLDRGAMPSALKDTKGRKMA